MGKTFNYIASLEASFQHGNNDANSLHHPSLFLSSLPFLILMVMIVERQIWQSERSAQPNDYRF